MAAASSSSKAIPSGALRMVFGSGVRSTLLSSDGTFVSFTAHPDGTTEGSCDEDWSSSLCGTKNYGWRYSRGTFVIDAQQRVCLEWRHPWWTAMEGCFVVREAGVDSYLLWAPKDNRYMALALGAQVPPKLWEVTKPEPVPIWAAAPDAIPSATAGAPRVASSAQRWNVAAEELAKGRQCNSAPHPVLTARASGLEIYSVTCTDGDTIFARCEYGECRLMR